MMALTKEVPTARAPCIHHYVVTTFSTRSDILITCCTCWSMLLAEMLMKSRLTELGCFT